MRRADDHVMLELIAAPAQARLRLELCLKQVLPLDRVIVCLVHVHGRAAHRRVLILRVAAIHGSGELSTSHIVS